MFDLDQFIADLPATLADRLAQAGKEVIARAVSDPASLISQIGEPDKAAVQVLHQAPDLTVLNVIWAPGQVTLPHDHRVSAVIGMYGGREDNMIWRGGNPGEIPDRGCRRTRPGRRRCHASRPRRDPFRDPAREHQRRDSRL